MTLKVTFDLSERDLRHFRREMKQARETFKDMTELQVIQATDALLDQVRKVEAPDFVKERLDRLQMMIDMLTDHDWQLPDKERHRVLSAMVYFANPHDLIPDHIPGLGFLDDAIMVELIVRELQHEIDAYADFCEYRTSHKVGRKPDPEHMTRRRKQLHERMRRRRKRDRTGPRAGTRSPVGFF